MRSPTPEWGEGAICMYCHNTQIYHILAGSYLYTSNSLVVIIRSPTLGGGTLYILSQHTNTSHLTRQFIQLFGGYHEIPSSVGVGGWGTLYVLSQHTNTSHLTRQFIQLFGGHHEIPSSGEGGGTLYVLSLHTNTSHLSRQLLYTSNSLVVIMRSSTPGGEALCLYCLYTQIHHILAGSYLYTSNSLVGIIYSYHFQTIQITPSHHS